MAQEIDRLFAMPTISPRLPLRSAMPCELRPRGLSRSLLAAAAVALLLRTAAEAARRHAAALTATLRSAAEARVRRPAAVRAGTGAAPASTRVAEPASAAGVLAHRELGHRTRVLLKAFGTRQRRADQRTMDGAFVGRRGRRLLVLWRRFRDKGSARRRLRFSFTRLLIVFRFVIVVSRCHEGRFGSDVGGLRLSPPWRLAALVGVLGVACRTPCLLDVVFDHRHDGVVRHASFARTIVVQNVTETQPALLHSRSPELCLMMGWKDRPCRSSQSTRPRPQPHQ